VANEKEPYVLIGLYLSLYKEKYNKSLTVNKFREKWAMNDVIESVDAATERVYKFVEDKLIQKTREVEEELKSGK